MGVKHRLWLALLLLSSACPAVAENAPNAGAENLCKQARARYDLGDWDGAIALCNRAIEMDSRWPQAYQLRGWAKSGKNDYDSALKDFDKVISLEPEKLPSVYKDRGSVRALRGDLDGAVSDFTKALELDPENKAAYRGRATARGEQGDLEGALEDFGKAIALDAKSGRAYIGRGWVLVAKEDFQAAAADFSKARELDPTDPYLPLHLWWLALRCGKTLDQARQDLAKEADLYASGNWPAPIFQFCMGQKSEAECLHSELSEGPERRDWRCETYYFLGQGHLAKGEKVKAQECFKKAGQKPEGKARPNLWMFQAAQIELKRLEHR